MAEPRCITLRRFACRLGLHSWRMYGPGVDYDRREWTAMWARCCACPKVKYLCGEHGKGRYPLRYRLKAKRNIPERGGEDG